MRQGRRRRADHDQHPARHGHRHRPAAAPARRRHRRAVRAGGAPGRRPRDLAGRAPRCSRAACRRCRSSASGECAPARTRCELVAAGAAPCRSVPRRSTTRRAPCGSPTSSPACSHDKGFHRFADVVGIAHDDGLPDAAPMSTTSDDRSAPGCAPRCDELGPLCVGHRPAPGPARPRGGCPTRCRARDVRDDLRRGLRRDGGRGQAAVGLLRAVRVGRAWRSSSAPWPGCARPARCPCSTSSAATSARRWRPTPQAYLGRRQPAAGRRHHGQPLPRLRVAAPGARPRARRPGAGSSCWRSPPTPRAPSVQHAGRDGATVAGSVVAGAAADNARRGSRPTRQRRHRRRRHGRRRGHRPRARPRGGQRPAARARARRPGRHRRGPARGLRCGAAARCWPAAAARCSARAPTRRPCVGRRGTPPARMAEVTAGR